MFQLESILTCDTVVFWLEIKQQVITSGDIEEAELISDPGIYQYPSSESWQQLQGEITAYPVIGGNGNS